MSEKDLLDKIYEKQEKMADDLTDMKVILAKQEENIRIHIYRTSLAEENIKMLREQIKPIETHVKMINGALKLIGVLSLVSGLALTIINIVKNF